MESFFSFLIIFGLIVFRIYTKSQKAQSNSSNRAGAKLMNKMEQTQENRRIITEAERQKVENYRQKKTINQKNPNIVERAKNNTAKYQKDTTMEQLELEHGHSEGLKSTGAKEYLKEQKEAHPHDAAHVAKELAAQDGTLLGTVEDLMIKGYDGNLSFERDFVGEGMDMINSFTLSDMKLQG